MRLSTPSSFSAVTSIMALTSIWCAEVANSSLLGRYVATTRADCVVLGRVFSSLKKAYVIRVAQSCKQWMGGIKNRGNFVTIEVCGADPILSVFAFARIAFAAGAGATPLTAFVELVVRKSALLALPDAASIRDEWVAKGKQAGMVGPVPRDVLRVLARNLMTETALEKHKPELTSRLSPHHLPARTGELLTRYLMVRSLVKLRMTTKFTWRTIHRRMVAPSAMRRLIRMCAERRNFVTTANHLSAHHATARRSRSVQASLLLRLQPSWCRNVRFTRSIPRRGYVICSHPSVRWKRVHRQHRKR